MKSFRSAKFLLRVLLVLALMAEDWVYGSKDILSTNAANFFIINGVLATDFNTSYLNNGIYWGKACMDNAKTYLGHYPALRIGIAGMSDTNLAFGFELPASETIASILLLTGDYSYFIAG